MCSSSHHKRWGALGTFVEDSAVTCPVASPADAATAPIMDPSSSIAISGSFTLSSITYEGVKASEESIKKVIAKMYNILEKYITIVSIEEVDKSNGKNRFLASYTIKGFADQATADQAKESFETTVTDGSKFELFFVLGWICM